MSRLVPLEERSFAGQVLSRERFQRVADRLELGMTATQLSRETGVAASTCKSIAAGTHPYQTGAVKCAFEPTPEEIEAACVELRKLRVEADIEPGWTAPEISWSFAKGGVL